MICRGVDVCVWGGGGERIPMVVLKWRELEAAMPSLLVEFETDCTVAHVRLGALCVCVCVCVCSPVWLSLLIAFTVPCRLFQFAEWCCDCGTHGCRVADRPYSLFEGQCDTLGPACEGTCVRAQREARSPSSGTRWGGCAVGHVQRRTAWFRFPPQDASCVA